MTAGTKQCEICSGICNGIRVKGHAARLDDAGGLCG